jgi:hypothetical protein
MPGLVEKSSSCSFCQSGGKLDAIFYDSVDLRPRCERFSGWTAALGVLLATWLDYLYKSYIYPEQKVPAVQYCTQNGGVDRANWARARRAWVITDFLLIY